MNWVEVGGFSVCVCVCVCVCVGGCVRVCVCVCVCDFKIFAYHFLKVEP